MCVYEKHRPVYHIFSLNNKALVNLVLFEARFTEKKNKTKKKTKKNESMEKFDKICCLENLLQ